MLMAQKVWPLENNSATPVIITAVEDTEAFDMHPQNILVMTDGWVEGPVAVVLRGGANAQATLEVLSRSGVRSLRIFHIEEKVPALEDIFLSTVVSEAHQLFDNVNITWRHDYSVADLIEDIGKDYAMLLFGAPLAKSEIAPFYQKIRAVYQGNIAIVRAPVIDTEFSDTDEIFKWVRERTFQARDFALPTVLRNSKKNVNPKVAVILPALNEEKTIGKVIETALEVKRAGIIDEVIVIDSDSTDQTMSIAQSYDIPVFRHAEIRPDLGTYHGKGEAMYKSAFVTDADILAWVDTDIENITPSFFYGLLGPILTFPELKFAKGYFARPVRVESSGIELGGGRVTEIFARPWINVYKPELAGYIQPLAGTVAIRRNILEQMRIPTNYGVEIAMLIQAVELGGLWSTCQVNLGEVIHKSKDVAGLSEMAFQILQVLAEMESPERQTAAPVLRRVYSAQKHFEISSKRYPAYWRQYGVPDTI